MYPSPQELLSIYVQSFMMGVLLTLVATWFLTDLGIPTRARIDDNFWMLGQIWEQCWPQARPLSPTQSSSVDSASS